MSPYGCAVGEYPENPDAPRDVTPYGLDVEVVDLYGFDDAAIPVFGILYGFVAPVVVAP